MNHIVYHAYGHQAILAEAARSMLSFFKHNSPELAQIHVYTDNAAFFQTIFTNASTTSR